MNFELNLRTYKNSSNFKGDAPWLYPAPKQFSPDKTMHDVAERAAGGHYDPMKNQFLDDFGVHNQNELSHIHQRSLPMSVFRTVEW